MAYYGNRIYFDKNSKVILYETHDRRTYTEDDGIIDTPEWDFENTILKIYSDNKENIAFIQTKYGEIRNGMNANKCNSYRINSNNQIEYYNIEYDIRAYEDLRYEEIEDLKAKIEELEKDKIDLSLATAELYEKLEADKLEVFSAIAESYEANM